MLNPDQIAGLIASWAQDRGNQFQFNWVVKGGWEGWIQVDLVAYAFQTIGTDVDVLREQAIYQNNRKRVDLLWNGTTAPPANQVPTEIKAQSFENRQNFLPGLEEDVDKLTNERTATYATSPCFAMGVAQTPDAVQGMLAITRQGHPIFTRVYQSQESAVGLALWLNNAGWQPAVG